MIFFLLHVFTKDFFVYFGLKVCLAPVVGIRPCKGFDVFRGSAHRRIRMGDPIWRCRIPYTMKK